MSIARVLANEQQFHVEHTDVFAGCASLPPKSIHAICSSPPYLGLRDYGIPPRLWPDGLTCCYGLEPDAASYVRHTVMLFDEFRRVLRDDGVISWNLGDSYAAGGGKQVLQTKNASHGLAGMRLKTPDEQGQKMLIPHRVAIALADAGWIIRQDNVWAKKSPMPESISGWRWVRCKVKSGRKPVDWSVTPKGWDVGEGGHDKVAGGNYRQNGEREKTVAVYEPCPGCPKCEPNGGYVLRRGSWRTTGSHEYIFQIVKSGEYFCDGDAAQEKASQPDRVRADGVSGDKHNGTKHSDGSIFEGAETRNPRSVWHLSSESYKGAHFATFPSGLARRCIVASCSPGGCCPRCGSQYAPRVSKERVPTRPGENTKTPGKNSRFFQERDPSHPGDYKADKYEMTVGNRDPQRHIAVSRVDGYFPTCKCMAGKPVPPIVLEPFCGSGTTLQVARHYGHRAIGFEVNPAYIELAKERIVKTPRCAMPKKAAKKAKPPINAAQAVLFN